MNVPLLIARRYLLARKAHRATGIISAVSAVGIAVGTAALIIILSVYNGFDALIKDSLSTVDPDLKITPASGKLMDPSEERLAAAWEWAEGQDAVELATAVVEEQVYLLSDGRQALVLAKGVDDEYLAHSQLQNLTRPGEAIVLDPGFGQPRIALGQQVAMNLGIQVLAREEVELYFPSRKRAVSLQNPAASLEHLKLRASAAFSSGSEYDAKLVLLPRHLMQELLECDEGEISALEIRFRPGTEEGEVARIAEELNRRLGEAYTVRDRVAQNSALFKMMEYEKGAIFLLLLAVVVIVAFNIFGSLSMLILEKQEDVATLESLGAARPMLRNIFFYEGFLVSLAGLVLGLILGLGTALLQQQVGLVRMPGNFTIDFYPVILRWSDILLTVGGVALIGLLVAFLASRSVKAQTDCL